jgi:UPF0755 protein
MLEGFPTRTERKSDRQRRRRGAVVLLVLLLAFMAVAVAVGGFYTWATGASGAQKPVVFVIPPGATGSEVADLLAEKGVVRSALGFRVAAWAEGSSMQFDAGTYDLTTNMDAGAVLAVLEEGPLVERGIQATFPEGYRLEQMADRAEDQLGVDHRKFAELATGGHFALPPYLPEATDTVEGFLFPSTYEFDKGVTEEDVIQRMIDQFAEEARALPWEEAERPSTLGLTPYQMVIVASLIEREARFQEDRPKIAAVIYNRLEQGMRLEIDATVQYGLGNWGPILRQDRELDHPYNTYRIDGLPPGPICSPGLPSLEAAQNPANADFLYYVVIDAEGHHAFTASYEEFLQLVDQYQGV